MGDNYVFGNVPVRWRRGDAAQNNFFIAAHRDSNGERLKRMCGAIARRYSGNVYLAFVCHPGGWVVAPRDPSVFEWLAGDWEAIQA